MKGKTKEIIDGYLFDTENLAKKARKEEEGIKYIRQRVDMENPEAVLQIYNRLRTEKMFETPVGFSFLRELQEYLFTVPQIKNKDVAPLDITPVIDAANEENRQFQEEKLKRAERRLRTNRREAREKGRKNKPIPEYKGKFQTVMILNIFLLAAVAAMLIIGNSGENPNIINYENKLIDKYESWEKELTNREKAIEEYEEKYHIEP